jgi:hypothetical protein
MKQKSPRAGGAKASVSDRADQDGSLTSKNEKPQLRYVVVSGPDWLDCYAAEAVYDSHRKQIKYSGNFAVCFYYAAEWAGTTKRFILVSNTKRADSARLGMPGNPIEF